MSSDNLGRLVKWIDENDQWHTGRIVTLPPPYDHPIRIGVTWTKGGQDLALVRESCDGRLTWAELNRLLPWQMRNEWEDKPQGFDSVVNADLVSAVRGDY